MDEATMLWRRLDCAGHDAACLVRRGDGYRLEGAAIFVAPQGSCRLHYTVECDSAWRTRTARICGRCGIDEVDARIAALGGRWYLNGAEYPPVSGCTDVDLGFTPATNLLPVRRLDLPVGGEAVVRSAWFDFPDARLQLLEQVYRRVDETTYRYESGGGAFQADLLVAATGFVVDYPGLWIAET